MQVHVRFSAPIVIEGVAPASLHFAGTGLVLDAAKVGLSCRCVPVTAVRGM